MIKIYRKTATIQAEQFDGSLELVKRYSIRGIMAASNRIRPQYFLETSDGKPEIRVGDWIATGVDGEHWPIADEIFKKTYAELPVIPEPVADWIEMCKQNKSSIGDMLCSESRPEKVRDWMALMPGTYYFNQERYKRYQNITARAWLDGYQIEEEDE